MPLQDGKLSQGARLTAGLGAGVSEALLIVTPFEVVKTRLQQQKGMDKALLKYRVGGRMIAAPRCAHPCYVLLPGRLVRRRAGARPPAWPAYRLLSGAGPPPPTHTHTPCRAPCTRR